MPTPDHARVGATFARYARSHRKRRAWSAANPGNAAIQRELAARALTLAGRDLRDGDVLDVGCGTGWWLERLGRAGVAIERLHGIDLLGDRARAAARRMPGATVVEGDARALPFPDGQFRVVTLFLVLSSLPSDDAVRAVLSEVRRVTATGGAVLVWEPRIPTPNRATRRIAGAALTGALGRPEADEPITLLPPLARRLGRHTAAGYPRLAAVSALRSHRLRYVRPAGRADA